MNAATPVKKRLFLAVNLSLATTRKIAEAVDRMRRAAEGKLRVAWVPPPNLHITLKFLGWANVELVPAIREIVAQGTRSRRGFELVAQGAGAFPSEKSPRVLWVGVADPSGTLGRIAADVEGWMEQLGFPRETRPFSPHVTIGRVKEGKSAEELLAQHRETDFGKSLVREIVLYESQMKSSGSEYTAVARIPLDAPPYRAERQTGEVKEGTPSSEEQGGPHGGESA